MITPSPMELVSFVVLREHAEDVAHELLSLGSFHPVDIRSIEEKIKGLTPSQIEKESQELEGLQTKVRDLLRKMKLQPAASYGKDMASSSYDEIEARLNNLEASLEPLLQEKAQVQEEMNTNRAILSQVRDYFPLPIQRGSMYSFLQVSTGRVDEKNLAVLERSMQGIPHVVYPFRKDGPVILCLFIGLRRDKALIQKVLDDVAWEEIELPKESEQLSRESQRHLAARIQENRKAMAAAEEKIKGLGRQHYDDLSATYSYINLKKSLLEAKRFSCTTDKTAVFAGWVPQDEKQGVIRRIKSLTDSAYVEAKSVDEVGIPKEEVPVRFQHGALVKPFEMLIDAYGIPRYGTIDPTIFVAFSFLVMFGAMFGDIGHGAVLVLAGLPMVLKPAAEFLKKRRGIIVNRQAGTLLLYCGSSAMLFGVLYGSCFGFEFESVWIKPMEDIMGIFRAGIMFGIALITVGIVLNITNALRDRDYAKAVFDKAGLIGGVVYWAAIGLVSKVFFSKGAINPVYSYLIFSGLLVLFLYPMIDNLFIRRHGSFVESVMESLVGILEIFMGYLSNTVSFIRVAAFALAHAGLFLAIFTLSRATNPASGTGVVASWLIIIFGNILVVLLEGLIVSIQSLRLNYYEFFSKFFISGKRMYKPLSV
ncbi:MAG: V-type ATPase 116kDa subunit family protein [Candidatus Omnitrophica bacterium]|nr:V-type ATPase 116kDa subunit family protein [Candidatus Omnitrophota bacterium]